jgi:DNA-binding transcriptional ArsR family regulator
VAPPARATARPPGKGRRYTLGFEVARLKRYPVSVDVFHAIADPTRRELLDRLSDGEQPVGRLAAAFSMTLSAVSQHLRLLREAGLVVDRREGRERLYRLNPAPLREVAGWVHRHLDA